MVKDKFVNADYIFSHRLTYVTQAKWYPTLSAAQRLNFLQYHSLDVIMCVILVIVLTLGIMAWYLMWLFTKTE